MGRLARRLAARGHPVAVTGSTAERALCERVAGGGVAPESCAIASGEVRSLAGSLNLHALADAVGQARLLVCGDTGVTHLATALGTPSVLLFGPTPPQWWGPTIDLERHRVLWHGTGRGDPHADVLDQALAAITIEEVWAATAELLGDAERTSLHPSA
ncbi:glycosyltransferase family 9 protein [Georgenia yuyongxinii]